MSLVEQTLRKLQEARRGVPEHEGSPKRGGDDRCRETDTRSNSPRLPIDLAALRKAGLVPANGDERRLTAQYRHIKRPLIGNATGRGAPRLANGHLIVIASAMPGEGKTFTAINLALSMSLEKDVQVVLVDADVPKPQLSHMLGASDTPGLLDVLRDETLDVERVILKTDIPNLSIIPAGGRSPEATELLASARMAKVASQLCEHNRRRIVLFDSPPLLLTNESQVLTAIAGQIVVVVRAGLTPQPVLLDALELVQGEAPVYLILNQSTRSPRDAYYYYGYGEEYGEADGETPSVESTAEAP